MVLSATNLAGVLAEIQDGFPPEGINMFEIWRGSYSNRVSLSYNVSTVSERKDAEMILFPKVWPKIKQDKLVIRLLLASF